MHAVILRRLATPAGDGFRITEIRRGHHVRGDGGGRPRIGAVTRHPAATAGGQQGKGKQGEGGGKSAKRGTDHACNAG